jgi:hypothetical protein
MVKPDRCNMHVSMPAEVRPLIEKYAISKKAFGAFLATLVIKHHEREESRKLALRQTAELRAIPGMEGFQIDHVTGK